MPEKVIFSLSRNDSGHVPFFFLHFRIQCNCTVAEIDERCLMMKVQGVKDFEELCLHRQLLCWRLLSPPNSGSIWIFIISVLW